MYFTPYHTITIAASKIAQYVYRAAKKQHQEATSTSHNILRHTVPLVFANQQCLLVRWPLRTDHLFQTFWDSDKLYLIDVAFVGKSKTRREPRGQPCTNNTYNIWRESTVKKSSRLHGHGTFRPTCELERGPTGARQLGIRGSYGME